MRSWAGTNHRAESCIQRPSGLDAASASVITYLTVMSASRQPMQAQERATALLLHCQVLAVRSMLQAVQGAVAANDRVM